MKKRKRNKLWKKSYTIEKQVQRARRLTNDPSGKQDEYGRNLHRISN